MSRPNHELLMECQPCPFCGNAGEKDHWAQTILDGMKGMVHHVTCNQCGCDGPPSSSLANAVRMWNDRPGPNGAPPKWLQKINTKKADAKLRLL